MQTAGNRDEASMAMAVVYFSWVSGFTDKGYIDTLQIAKGKGKDRSSCVRVNPALLRLSPQIALPRRGPVEVSSRTQCLQP